MIRAVRSPPTLDISAKARFGLNRMFGPLNESFGVAGLRDPDVAADHGKAWMRSLDEEAERFSADVRRLLSGYPLCLVIRELDPDLGCALLTGLASALGRFVLSADRPGYQVIRELRPRLDRVAEAGRALNELLHTDGTDEPRPNDLTCLFCVRADGNGGGESVIMPEADFAEALDSAGGNLLNWVRRTPLPWRLSDDRGGVVMFENAMGPSGLRWMCFTVRAAMGEDANPDLCERLDRVQDCLEGAQDRHIRTYLKPGDLLILDNRRTLHSRTMIPRVDTSERIMLRAKVDYSRSAPITKVC